MLTVRLGSIEQNQGQAMQYDEDTDNLTVGRKVSWDGNHLGGSRPTASNANLSARNVELRSAGDVETNLFNSQEVLETRYD